MPAMASRTRSSTAATPRSTVDVRLRRRLRPRRRTRSRRTRSSRAARTVTSSWSTRTPAGSTSCSTRDKVGGTWYAGSGATWDLRSNALRPAGCTSADAAGLPILPGLVRYDEVAAGADRPRPAVHDERTRNGLHLPGDATTPSSQTSPSLPPMGLRVRLKASLRHQPASRRRRGSSPTRSSGTG